MKSVKVSELKQGDIFTETLQLRNRKSYRVTFMHDDYISATGNNFKGGKDFKIDQNKPVILLKEK
jgi:hypothetical protein